MSDVGYNELITLSPAKREGTLDEKPELEPIQSIHWSSKAQWFICPGDLPQHDALPVKPKKDA